MKPRARETSRFLETVDEAARRRFEAARHAGQAHALDEFLPPADNPHFLATLEELIHIELEYAWKSWGSTPPAQRSQPALVENYLKRFPVLNQAPIVRRLVEQELLVRQRHGDRPEVDEYRRRFPDLSMQPDPNTTTSPVPVALTALPAIEGFEMLGFLARGGMGAVYKARQVQLDRVVAVKMMVAGVHASAEDLQRFQVEATAVARLQHPNVVQIHEVGSHDGRPYFAMEYVEGGSLAEKLAGGPQPARQAAELVEVLSRAVHAAHQAGIVHRDLKPGNVLLARDGTPKVTDFGLAKRLEVGSGQTRTGDIVGTPSYMAPEQAAGKIRAVGPTTDVYGLGTILYEMVTGRPPFWAETPMDTMLQVLGQDPVPPSRLQPKVPRDLETICLCCLHKEPRQRYPSAEELARDLRRFLDGRPIVARPVSLVERATKWMRRRPAVTALTAALVVAVLGLAAGGIWFTFHLQAALVDTRKERDRATDLAEKEAQARQLAEAERNQAQMARYTIQLNLARRQWQDNNLRRAGQILDDCRPELRHWEYDYLRRLHAGSLLTCAKNHNTVSSIVYSPDGRRLAAAALDKTVSIWDAVTGQELLALKGYASAPLYATFSSDGRQVIVAEEKTVTVRDAQSGKEMRAMPLQGAPAMIQCAVLSSDGRRLAMGVGAYQQPGEIRVWDTTTGQLLQVLKGHTGMILSVAFGSRGGAAGQPELLASGSRDKTVKVWDLGTGQAVHTLVGHAAWVGGVAFRPDGLRLASAAMNPLNYDESGEIKVWDATTGKELFTLKGDAHLASRLAFSSDGQRLATGGWDGLVKVWDAETGRERLSLRGHTNTITSLVFSPDGQRLASACFGWEDIGSYLFVGSNVKVWDAVHGPEAVSFTGDTTGDSVAFSPDGKLLAAASGNQNKGGLSTWDVQTGRLALPLEGHARRVNGMAFSPDGTLFASASQDGTVKVWSVDTRQEVLTFRGHGDEVTSVAFHPDGRRLASASRDHTVKVWELPDGKPLLSLEVGEDMVLSVVFSPDGRLLAGGAGSPYLRNPAPPTSSPVWVWEMETGRAAFRFEGHTGRVHSVAFSPDGRWLASASEDRTARLWDLASGQERLTFKGHTRWVMGLAFSPDGRRLATTATGGGHGQSSEVKLWDPDTGQEVLALLNEKGPWSAGSLAFSPGGQQLAGGGPGEVRIWDAALGKETGAVETGSGPGR